MKQDQPIIIKTEWIKAAGVVFGLKLALLLVFLYAHSLLPKEKYDSDIWMTRPGTPLLDNLANFDGAWFVRLAAIGCRKLTGGEYDLQAETKRLRVMDRLGYEDGIERNYAYRHWPLFSWLIRAAHPLTGDYVLAGVLLANFFSFTYGFFFYKLARIYLNESGALLALAIGFIHPGAYSLTALYNEPLFLTAVSACFYYLHNKNFLGAGLAGGIASLTRIESLLIYVPVVYEYLKQTTPTAGGLWSALSPSNIKASLARLAQEPSGFFLALLPLGFVATLAYFKVMSGDALMFTRVHETNQYGGVGFPWQMLWATYQKGWETYLKELPLHALLLATIIFSWRKVHGTIWVWMASFWLFYTTNGNHSYLRYQVMCIPMFISLSVLLAGRPVLKYLYLVASASAMAFFAARYINGYWVA